MLRYAPALGLRLRLSSFQPLINHHILPPAMRINKNKMKKRVIHYDGEQNLNKTNKWREWKQTVIAYYWLFGSSIWEAVAEITWGGGTDLATQFSMGKGWPYGLHAETCVLSQPCCYGQLYSQQNKRFLDGCQYHQLFLQYSVRILKAMYAAPPHPLLPLSSPYLRWESPFTVASKPRSAIWDLGVFFWRLVWMEAVTC